MWKKHDVIQKLMNDIKLDPFTSDKPDENGNRDFYTFDLDHHDTNQLMLTCNTFNRSGNSTERFIIKIEHVE